MRQPDDPEVAAWLGKAGEDSRAAAVLARHAPHLEDIIAFHCQQNAEKLFKALFVAVDREPPRTHDLDALIASLLPDFPSLARVRDAATFLKAYAVVPRYPVFLPSEHAPGSQSGRAMEAAAAVGEAVAAVLGSRSTRETSSDRTDS
jgi:HEPN domain-containing protein